MRSLDGSGPQHRGVRLSKPMVSGVQPGQAAKCSFPLTNTGQAATNTTGRTVTVPVYVSRTPGSAQNTTVTLTAKSESDPTATHSLTCVVDVADTTRR